MAGLVAIQTGSLFTALILNGAIAEVDAQTSRWFIVSDLHTFTLYIYMQHINLSIYEESRIQLLLTCAYIHSLHLHATYKLVNI